MWCAVKGFEINPNIIKKNSNTIDKKVLKYSEQIIIIIEKWYFH